MSKVSECQNVSEGVVRMAYLRPEEARRENTCHFGSRGCTRRKLSRHFYGLFENEKRALGGGNF